MWGRKRQKIPPERTDPAISDIIPFVTLEHIVLPEDLREESTRRKDITQEYEIVLEQAKKKANDILIKNA